MPDMSSANAATDAARRLADALANTAPAAPFAHFSAHTIDAIGQVADIFAATGAPPNSPFDYNRIYMAPPATKVLIQDTPLQRRTWDFHGK